MLNIKNASSSEFGISKNSVVGLMGEWIKDGKLMKGTDKNLGAGNRIRAVGLGLRLGAQ